jgi:hypothetical protein
MAKRMLARREYVTVPVSLEMYDFLPFIMSNVIIVRHSKY